MKVDKRNKTLYSIGAVASSILLFLAIGDHPYGYFTTLRWITCAVSIFGAYLFYGQNRIYLVIPLGVTAVLFNPIIPFYLGRRTWQLIDIMVGIFLLFTIIFTWRKKGGDELS